MATHIQLHRTCVTGGTPDPSVMLEGEPAVNLRDKKLWVKGCENNLITLIGGASGERVAGTVNEVQYEGDGGFSADPKFTYNSASKLVNIGGGGGISADGATFGIKGITASGNIRGANFIVPDDGFIGVSKNDDRIVFDTNLNTVAVKSDTLEIQRLLEHLGDSDTYLEFTPDNISLQAGGTKFLEANVNGVLHAPTGVSGDGATFGVKGITLQGDIYMANQSSIRVQDDTEAIFMNAGGGQFVFAAPAIDIQQKLRHYGDPDTYLEFTPDNISLQAGGTKFLEANANGVLHAPVGISGGGATFGGNVTAPTFVGALTGNVTGNASGSAATATTAAVATTVTITDNENTAEDNAIIFAAGGDIDGGNLGLESDGTLTYNPSTGKVTATGFVGNVTGNASGSAATVTTAAQTAITSVGTLTGLQVSGGATFGDDIALENNDYINNPSAHTVRIMPEGTSATDYGLEFEFSDWGYGSVITNRRASDLANAGSIRFDTPVVINNDKDFTFGGSAHSRMRYTTTGNNTLQIGVSNQDSDNCSGALALINASHLGQSYRSPVTEHVNPNFYVYSISTPGGAVDRYIRFEHDGTDANIVTGAGDISLQPSSGVVGVSGGIDVSGDILCNDNLVTRPELKDYAETVNAIGTITGDTAVSFAAGNVQTVTGNGDCLFTFTNPPASGKAGTLTMIITNGGANTTTWHSSVKWPGDNAPALTASGVDVISFMTIDAGTTVYGFVGGINFS